MSIPTISDVAGIAAQPELKFTNSGKAVLNLRLAFNDSKYDEQQGKWVNTRTFYVDGTAWEQTAERLAEQLAQGDQIYVSGRLETQSWEQDGQKRSKPVLNVQTARKLAPSQAQAASQQSQQHAQAAWGGQPASAGTWNQAVGQAPQSAGWGTGDQSQAPF
jgi:single-strand DNA-binding protein